MLASVLLAVAVAQAPASTTAPNPAVQARAREWFGRLQRDDVDYGQLDAQAASPLNSDVALVVSTDWSALGAPVTFDQVQAIAPTAEAPDWTYVYRATFSNGAALDFFFGLDGAGKISAMRLGPETY
jgi:hypothetical protein